MFSNIGKEIDIRTKTETKIVQGNKSKSKKCKTKV